LAQGRTLLIVRKPPYGLVDSWEVMRLALSFYAANVPVSSSRFPSTWSLRTSRSVA
jgi:hypothetical protein